VAGSLGVAFVLMTWWLDMRAADRQAEFERVRQADLAQADERRARQETVAANLRYLREAVGRNDPRSKVFSGLDLAGVDLTGLDLSCDSYERTEPDGVVRFPPGCADFSDADLRNVRFARTQLRGARFDGADLRGASLIGMLAKGADFTGADFRKTVMVGQFHDAIFDFADFRGATLRLGFRGARFDGALFKGARIVGTFSGLQFPQAQFGGADLRKADLRMSSFTCADLRGARLKGADLRGADLEHSFVRAKGLQGARVDTTTRMPQRLKDTERGCEDGDYEWREFG
jgi:uncharacterized protein YjbI with pentapeptide repeats